jgi:hypothetical protein
MSTHQIFIRNRDELACLTQLGTQKIRIESVDEEFLKHLQSRIERELGSEVTENVERIDIEIWRGIDPVTAALVIAFATPILQQVGEKIGEIIAKEIDQWYSENDKSGVETTETRVAVEDRVIQ